MTFFYSESTRPFTGVPVPYHKQPANAYHLKHFQNYMFLRFILDNSKDWQERKQADKEIGIATRKMEHWQNHPNFNTEEWAQQKAGETKKWSS